jgi:uncharacterized membrane protein YfcA
LECIAISFVVGLYDGFIGPGTGSFWYFITLWDSIFHKASANAKMVNLSTNFGSICLFILKVKSFGDCHSNGC